MLAEVNAEIAARAGEDPADVPVKVQRAVKATKTSKAVKGH
jgi:hypothetical protein